MKLRSTQKAAGNFLTKTVAFLLFFFSFSGVSFAQINESFTTAVPLPSGWVTDNNSEPLGTVGHFQGNPAAFAANSGAPNAYIAVNFQSTTGAGVISNWLITPPVNMTNGDIFTFWTRTTDPGATVFPDRLQLRVSLNGTSTNVGTTSTDVGDFTNLAVEINPTLTTTGYPSVWTQYSYTVTGLPAQTVGRFAFRYFVTDGGPTGANSDYIGIDDVVFNGQNPGCTATPAPGNTLSTGGASSCAGVPFTLSVQNASVGTGISYQWQSSTDGVTYTNIAGANSDTYGTSLTTNGFFYQLVVTCATTSTSGTSTPIQVALTPASGCYCTTSVAGSADDEDIFRVQIGTLDNSSDCNTLAPGFGSIRNRYSNYALTGPTAPAPDTIVAGTNPLRVTIGTCGGVFGNSVAVFIDQNQNGNFEPTEVVYRSPAATAGPHVETGIANVSTSALIGKTLMRVVNVETGNPANITACGAYAWGETEDYFVYIRECDPGVVTRQPVAQTTTCNGNAEFTAAFGGDNPSFQWQVGESATGPWQLITNGGVYTGATNDTLTITGAGDNLDGKWYRVVYFGACNGPETTDAASLTVTKLGAIVTPNPVEICASATSQAITINNLIPSPVTNTTVSSGAVTVNIPDNDPIGVQTGVLNLASLPPGAVVTEVTVRFDINHTWVGDLDINLIAPNGAILNLVGALNGGGGGNGSDDFVNTRISSTSTNLISGAAAPRTGIFAAERRTGYGPTGFEQLAGTNWANLTASPIGDWKLAIADFVQDDFGSLTQWSITFGYTIPVGAPGIWSPATGLFTDAGLTSAYGGTPANTVYTAPPTADTEVSVVVSTPNCTTDPLTIPIIRATPLGTVTDPSDANGCTAASVTFTADASAGNPILYQWEESTNGGASFSPVADGGVYSGATTNTLTITNPTLSMDGNQYRLVMGVTACSSNATTDAATLSVYENASVTIGALPFTSLYPGLQTVLTATLNPAAGTGTQYQWNLNGAPVTGANNATYIADVDGLGTYTVDVIDVNGCPGSSNSVVLTDSANTNLFIYPNPNTGVFGVRYNDKLKGTTGTRFVSVFDSKGARVFTQQFINIGGFQKMEIDLSNQPKGVYFIEVHDRGGIRLESGRVIIF